MLGLQSWNANQVNRTRPCYVCRSWRMTGSRRCWLRPPVVLSCTFAPSIGLSWATSRADLLDSVNVRYEYDVDLGPNRRATVIETQEQDSQRSQYAVVEQLTDGMLIKLDTYRVSRKAAIKIATTLSWDRQRGSTVT